MNLPFSRRARIRVMSTLFIMGLISVSGCQTSTDYAKIKRFKKHLGRTEVYRDLRLDEIISYTEDASGGSGPRWLLLGSLPSTGARKQLVGDLFEHRIIHCVDVSVDIESQRTESEVGTVLLPSDVHEAVKARSFSLTMAEGIPHYLDFTSDVAWSGAGGALPFKKDLAASWANGPDVGETLMRFSSEDYEVAIYESASAAALGGVVTGATVEVSFFGEDARFVSLHLVKKVGQQASLIDIRMRRDAVRVLLHARRRLLPVADQIDIEE
jgi:hypothetical protein